MMYKSFLLLLACVTLCWAGICQDVFPANSKVRPFFRIFESQGVEIYFPKRDPKQEMFGIKLYKNQDLRKKNLHCDLCVNTTFVEDGCFKIKSTSLAVEVRDVLKYVTLAKFAGKTDVTVTPSNKTEFSDYVIPAGCVCRDSQGEYCSKASTSKITEYRPLFKFTVGTGFAAYLPKTTTTATVGLQVLRNANFRAGRGSNQQKLDLDVESFNDRDGCFAYESVAPASRFNLGDHINFVVTGNKIGGAKIRTDPRKVFLTDYFIPATCTCAEDSSNLVKSPKKAKN